MSKFVKDHLTDQVKTDLKGVNDVLVVSLTGLSANSNYELRKRLRSKKIQLRVVKNSLARRATEGTVIASAFTNLTGPAAVVWGGEDIVALAKEIVALEKEKEFKLVAPKGGAMDGAPLSAEDVKKVSSWPSRGEQLSILAGQITSVAGLLASQLTSIGGAVASQIKQKSEGPEEAPAGDAPAPAAS
jgi:large subunit ribosomal protein L10